MAFKGLANRIKMLFLKTLVLKFIQDLFTYVKDCEVCVPLNFAEWKLLLEIINACIKLELKLLVIKLIVNSKNPFPAFLITQIDRCSRAVIIIVSSTDGHRKH